jgi:hypothetical protein
MNANSCANNQEFSSSAAFAQSSVPLLNKLPAAAYGADGKLKPEIEAYRKKVENRLVDLFPETLSASEPQNAKFVFDFTIVQGDGGNISASHTKSDRPGILSYDSISKRLVEASPLGDPPPNLGKAVTMACAVKYSRGLRKKVSLKILRCALSATS